VTAAATPPEEPGAERRAQAGSEPPSRGPDRGGSELPAGDDRGGSEPPRTVTIEVPVATAVRTVLVAALVVAGLYLLWLVRQPLTWVVAAAFLAMVLGGPVRRLEAIVRRRWLAIVCVYLLVLATPVALAAVVVPPLVREGQELAANAPRYARDFQRFVERNRTLARLDRDYRVTERVRAEAQRLPERVPDAARALRDVGFTVVNSLFAIVTVLVLSVFLVANGRRWVDLAIATRPPDQRAILARWVDGTARAVGGYAAGALVIAALSGTLAYIVLTILGVPFAAPLGLIQGLFSLIPLVGATLAAVLIGLVTVFVDFPTTTIVWAIWAVIYQQLENHLVQPLVQRRTVQVHPFVIIVAVLFGAQLLGVFGALIAIPVAASVELALREWFAWRATHPRPVAHGS
jgi:predicted PurR-regulated permease PerM